MRACPICGTEAELSATGCPGCGAPLPDVHAARTWEHVQYLLGEASDWEREQTVPAGAVRWIRDEYGARAETLAREVRAEDHLARARRLSQEGRRAEASARCRQALALTPERVDGWELLGTLCAAEGRWEEATEAFERGLSLAPDDSRLLLLCDRARRRQRETEEAARERPLVAALPHAGAPQATPAPDPIHAAAAAAPAAARAPWWQPLSAFLEERNIKYWHGIGIMVLLGGLLGLVQWQWDLLGRWVILGLLFGLTAGSYALGRRLGAEYQISRLVLLALAGLLLPLDLATAHAFLPVFHTVNADAARLAIALLCLPIYVRSAWRLREPLFVAFASAAGAGAAHSALQLLLPAAPALPVGSPGWRLLPDLYRRDGLLLLPLAAAHVLLACRLSRVGARELVRPLILAGQVVAGLGMAAALAGTPAAGGAGAPALARDGGLPAVLLLGTLFYFGSAYLLEESRYLRAAMAALAFLALAGRHAAGLAAPPWHAYLPVLMFAAALLACGGAAEEPGGRENGTPDETRFGTEYRRGAHALLGLVVAAMFIRWVIALAGRRVPADPGELVTLALVAAAGAALYAWLAVLQGTPGLLYLAGGAMASSLLAAVLRLDPSADRLALGPALALAAGACAAAEALLQRRGALAFAAPVADVALGLRLAAAGWVAYRYTSAIVLGMPVGAPRLAAVVTLVILTAPATVLAFTERRPKALYGAIAYGTAAYLLGAAALWDGPAAWLAPWRERNYGLMLIPLAAALALVAHRARRQPEFARPPYHLAAVGALGALGYQVAWMALPRGVVLLVLAGIAAALARLVWDIAAKASQEEWTSPPAPGRRRRRRWPGEGSSSESTVDPGTVPGRQRKATDRAGWLLAIILGVPVALDTAGVFARLPLTPAMGPTAWLGLAGAAALCVWLTRAADRAAYGSPAFAAVLPYGTALAGYGMLWQSFGLAAPQGAIGSSVAVARAVTGATVAWGAVLLAGILRRRSDTRWPAPLAWSACAAALASEWEGVSYLFTHLAVMAVPLMALGAFAAASVTLRRRWVAVVGLALFLLVLAFCQLAGSFVTTTPVWRQWIESVWVLTLLGAVPVVAWVAWRFRSAWFAGSASLLLVAAMLDWTGQVAGSWTAAACLAVTGLLMAGFKQVAAVLARVGHLELAQGPARVADLLALGVGWGLLAQLEPGSRLGPAGAVAGAAVAAAYAGEARRRSRPWLLYPAMLFAAGGWAGVVIAWLLPAARALAWEPNAALAFLPFGVSLAVGRVRRPERDTSGEPSAVSLTEQQSFTAPLRQGAIMVLFLVALAQFDAIARGWWATAAIAWAGVGAVASAAALLAAGVIHLPGEGAQPQASASTISSRAGDETPIHALIGATAACVLGAAYAGARWLGWGPIWAPMAMLAPAASFYALSGHVRERPGKRWDWAMALAAVCAAAFTAAVGAATAADASLPAGARALALAVIAVASCSLVSRIAEEYGWHGLHAGAATLLGVAYLAAEVGRLSGAVPLLASLPWLWAIPALLAALMIGHRAWWVAGADRDAAGGRLLLACAVATWGALAALGHAGVSIAAIGLGLAGVAAFWSLTAALRGEGWEPAKRLAAAPFTTAGAVCAGLSAVVALAGLTEANTGRFTVAALLLAGGTYAGLAVLQRARTYGHLAFACAMTAYALWLYDRIGIGAGVLDFYLIPIGLYLLALAAGLRRFQGRRGDDVMALEATGLLLALAPTLLASFPETGAAHSWLLLTESLLAIFWGVLRRIRVYAGLGTLFLVALLAQHAYEPLTHVHWAIYATLLGVAIIASALGFERRRAEVLAWASRVAAELREWE